MDGRPAGENSEFVVGVCVSVRARQCDREPMAGDARQGRYDTRRRETSLLSSSGGTSSLYMSRVEVATHPMRTSAGSETGKWTHPQSTLPYHQ